MSWFTVQFDSLRNFLDAGGPVLWVIGLVAAATGFLIVERFWFIYLSFPRLIRVDQAAWQAVPDHSTWRARQIRKAMISRAFLRLRNMLPMLRVLVVICPLLGLLGTVTGMVEVFDVVAALGTGNARAMASGISRATIPTMAGMVVAIPGLYFSLQLEQLTRRKADELADILLLRRGEAV